MNKLIAGALLFALSGVSSIARAELTPNPPAVVAEAPAAPPAPPTESAGATLDLSNYAAREAVTPALGEFKGGDAVIWVGGSAVTVLVVVLLVLIIV